MTDETTSKANGEAPAVVAALEHLTGVARGSTTWIVAEQVDILLIDRRRLHVVAIPPGSDRAASDHRAVARVRHVAGDYVLDAAEGASIWINGVLTRHRTLKRADVIEFGDDGPMTKLTLYREGGRAAARVTDLIADVATYLRRSRKPMGLRVTRGISMFVRRLLLETSFLFRGSVLAALIALTYFAYQLEQERARLQTQIVTGEERLDAFSEALKRAREEALGADDLENMQEEMRSGILSANQRLKTLELKSGAGPRIVSASESSVVLIQSGYAFRDKQSGRMLRHFVNKAGDKLFAPNGRPLLSLEADGPVAERQVTGTGFWIEGHDVVATNRHVALPWEQDKTVSAMSVQGLEPVMHKFVAFFPDIEEPLPLTFLRANDAVDLALLSVDGAFEPGPGRGLALSAVGATPGSEVFVLGYPTGLRAMLVQSDTEFLETLEEDGSFDFWDVSERLAKSGYIKPLASRGIVGKVTSAAVVYDAETTHGGSGGPVLNADGQVIAVNSAIIPEFGGSNFGVPVSRLTELIEAADGDD